MRAQSVQGGRRGTYGSEAVVTPATVLADTCPCKGLQGDFLGPSRSRGGIGHMAERAAADHLCIRSQQRPCSDLIGGGTGGIA